MKHLLINYNDLEIGQKLWDVTRGELIVVGLKPNAGYPIQMRRESGGAEYLYTMDGFYHNSHKCPTLYLSNPFEKTDDFPKLMECVGSNTWFKRIIVCKTSSGYLGIESHVNLEALNKDEDHKLLYYPFKHVREIQAPIVTEYTLKEIAEKLGVDVNSIRIKKY